ncbi:MAG TPA: SpoIIE family protein phosphatase [Casimicrobiaceae bacterium]
MPLKILFVDDEPDLESLILQKFRHRIREGDLEFVFASNGQDALDKLRADASLEIVFSDINMPVMDGLTLLTRIGELNRLLRTIIVTAYDDMQNIRTAMNRGAFDFLTKPIDFQDFEQTLAKTRAELDTIREALSHKEQLFALHSELSIASRIQQSILPSEFPQDPRYEIYAEMLPARTVGGDFYDFFAISDRLVGFAIGDVSGKGIPAALYMAVSRTLLRGAALQSATPQACLETVSRLLGGQRSGEMYVTLLYGVLDVATGAVDFAVAGQTPPFLIKASGETVLFRDVRGTMLGLFDDVEVGTCHLTLQAGETLLLYTDGVSDAENTDGVHFTQRRLEQTLRAAGRTARQTVESVLAKLESFRGDATQNDDVTVMALRYR